MLTHLRLHSMHPFFFKVEEHKKYRVGLNILFDSGTYSRTVLHNLVSTQVVFLPILYLRDHTGPASEQQKKHLSTRKRTGSNRVTDRERTYS